MNVFMCSVCESKSSQGTWCPAHPNEPLIEMYWCEDCQKYHNIHGNAKCPKCGACHYAHGKHVPDDLFPLSDCGKCGERHLWD